MIETFVRHQRSQYLSMDTAVKGRKWRSCSDFQTRSNHKFEGVKNFRSSQSLLTSLLDAMILVFACVC